MKLLQKQLFSTIIITILYVTTSYAVEPTAKKNVDNDFRCKLKNIDVTYGTLDIDATYRILVQRWEDLDMKSYPGTNMADKMLSERLWLDFNWKLNTQTRIFLELQDSRSDLSHYSRPDFSPHCSIENPLDIREAFIKLEKIFDTPIGIKMGRQRIRYADELIWGRGDWSNSGQPAYDAIKFSWDDSYLCMDTIWAKRILADPERFDNDHDACEDVGVYLTIKKIPILFDLFYVLKHDSTKIYAGESGTNSLSLHAIGTRIATKGNAGAFATLTLVAEFGDWGGSDISAFALSTKAGYKFATPFTHAVTLSYAFASGDSDPTDNKHETYDPLFQSVHALFGLMDVVSWENLHDWSGEFSIKPITDLSVTLSYHIFQLDEPRDAWYWGSKKPVRRDKTGSSGTDLGDELDLAVSFSLSDLMRLEVVYGRFVPGDFIKQTGPYQSANWLSLQTMISF